ncbi:MULTISPECIES: AAA family ATPase [unclassified Aeromicrobium]|uniref:AAA family ATPase n=1 Tax=unclassified Aeromicrobium TaxID=2633570 RepID=UPI00396B47AB
MTGAPEGVGRGELIAAARCAPSRVVGVTAAAGYGKSTLLRRWATFDHRTVVTASLTTPDDDPDLLVATLTEAFAAADGIPAPRRTSLRGLVAAVSARPRPFVLLVDDLQALRSAGAIDVVRLLAARIPSGSQLVTASRQAQPHLARLRAEHEALELTECHLAVDGTIARAILARAGLDVEPETASRLAQACEGWAAGVALAAAVAKESGDGGLDVGGDDRFVADYFASEVLGPLDADQRAFLRSTAILDRLGGELCDAVLERTDSAARLRDLEDSNRFVMPTGRGRAWYRHHRLFREFLLGELRREDPAHVERLHVRAAAWHESRGEQEAAIEHLLATSRHDRTAALVETAAPAAWERGESGLVQRWLTTLGEARLAAYPQLAVVQAWVAALTGDPATAQRWLAHLETTADQTPSLEADRALLRSALALDGPERALRDARYALTHVDPWSFRRARAVGLCGEAHVMLGQVDEAIPCLEEAGRAAVRGGHHHIVVGAQALLGWIAMDRGDWRSGGEHVRASVRATEEAGLPGHPATLLTRAGSARLHLRVGDRAAAHRELDAAVESRHVSTSARPLLAVKGRLAVAKLLWATGDHDGARELLRELHDLARERPDLGVLGAELAEFVVMVEGGARDDAVTTPLTPAELRVLPYLQTHLTIAQIGERLFVSRNTANSEIASIYRKLGVSTRGAAVARATVLGLLGQ